MIKCGRVQGDIEPRKFGYVLLNEVIENAFNSTCFSLKDKENVFCIPQVGGYFGQYQYYSLLDKPEQ